MRRPPSSKPIYPGGAPINLAMLCFSMNSDISILTIASSLSKRNSATALLSSVFPTPVGPRKRNDPIGFLGSFSPTLDLRMESATAFIAAFCPITRWLNTFSIDRSFSFSSAIILSTGIPVHLDTMEAISFSVTSSLTIFCLVLFFASSSCCSMLGTIE